MGSVRLGDFTHSSPTHSSQTSFPPPASSEDGRGRVSFTPFPGPGAGSPPLPPLHRCVTVGRSRLLTAQRTPRSEENRCPALAHSTRLGRSVPTGTKRAGARPFSEGLPSYYHPRLTTIATHHPLCTDPTLLEALPGPPCSQLTYASGVLARSTGSAPKAHCHNLESRVPPIPG